MPYDINHKSRTRKKILDSAYRLFSANGFEATSIEDIMLKCGLTRGGFYAHFRSKGQLYQEVMGSAAQSASAMPALLENSDEWLDAILVSCLRPFDAHTSEKSPWSFLATDVASKQPEVRAAYTCAFRVLSLRLSRDMEQAVDCDRGALAAMAMAVGALAVAMTVDDLSLRASLVNACRNHAKIMFENSTKNDRLSFFWATDSFETTRGFSQPLSA